MRSPSVVWPRGLNPGALAVLVCSLLVWSLLVLAGCDSGGSPGQTSSASVTASAGPSESATLSATPTPTATPSGAYKPADASGPAQNVPVPVLPEVAKTRTKEGLEAFTRYWYETLSYAYETGDTAELMAASGESCLFCQGLIEGVSASWRDERWISGGKIETPAITATLETDSTGYAIVQVIQQEIQIHKPDGGLYQVPTPSTNSGSRVSTSFVNSEWTVAELSLIK